MSTVRLRQFFPFITKGISGGEAEFWIGEFFFFSPGIRNFLVSYATELGILCA